MRCGRDACPEQARGQVRDQEHLENGTSLLVPAHHCRQCATHCDLLGHARRVEAERRAWAERARIDAEDERRR